MPRLLRPLLLALLLIAPGAFAEALYQVELIVFRQAQQTLDASQPAPEDWAANAAAIPAQNERSPALTDTAGKLESAQGYQVLLHKAWQQGVGTSPAPVRFSAGKQRDGHFPVEGVLDLSQERQLELALTTWINQFNGDGFLAASERLQVKRRLVPGQLTYLDHPTLGALIRVTPL
ncbi:CsiV family protein [Pseudomonas sp. GCM10022188]|uniref:CsiV family protein n=1 Tax=Pseudomonas TaxID=286 RepID=UPI001E610A30|nr:CsiV family protein [Pseudomonas oryzagri]MCC6077220.1 peptidoglycan binding protein CsiV [Pseudomonas oryzagri]